MFIYISILLGKLRLWQNVLKTKYLDRCTHVAAIQHGYFLPKTIKCQSYSYSILHLNPSIPSLESTFLEKDKNLCEKTMHSTAKQAAKIAKLASVEKLILGHFSSRYKDLNLIVQEAETIFNSVELAEDGKIFNF